MAKKLEDFTVRVNLDGWHVRGHGTCWEGQEFHGSEILPRMVKAVAAEETFKFMGTRAPVCILRGGTVDELRKAFAEAGLDINVPSGPAIEMPKRAAAPAPVEPPPPPPPADEDDEDDDEEEDEPSDDEEDDDEDDEVEVTKKSSKRTPKRRPRSRG